LVSAKDDKGKLLFPNIYMLNSGQYVMTGVAKGSFDAYINTWTYTWGIAPGDLLIRAIGGKVKYLEGGEIDYTKKE
jgi:fructose-1,6-bisphosphatase/inositol monophosphatase family enzyme